MARNRVIYQSEALFVSKDYNSTGLSDHTQLHRVQSANYGFTINRQDVNQFGNLARIDSLILEAPTVNFDISYYPTNGFNERALDFWVQNPSQLSEAQFASGHLANSTGQNFYILTVPEGRDANLNRVTGLNDNTIIGIGNVCIRRRRIFVLIILTIDMDTHPNTNADKSSQDNNHEKHSLEAITA